MKTIAVISQKGGAGKTTIAIHLAVAAERQKRSAAILDLDPQGSISVWRDLRQADTPVVVSAHPTRLPQLLDTAARNGADLAIIDTAPSSETSASAAARAADLVLIPCRPAILDLRAIHTTVDIAKLSTTPACIVLNAVPPRGGLGNDARSAVETYGLTISPVQLCQRAAFTHCLTLGQAVQEFEPDGKAAEEAQRLYKWTCKQVLLYA